MANNTLIIAIVLIAVIVIGALAATTLFKPNNPANATTTQGTKVSFQNNGTTWLHLDVIFENATLKNGTNQTFYSEMWIKPNGTTTIDLSQLLGYGDNKLPAGTTIRLLAWKNLFNNTTSANGALNLNLQGWSGSLQPVSSDAITNVMFSGMVVQKLPNGVRDSIYWIDNDMNKLEQQQGFIDDNDANWVYEEEILTVDSNGKVTITLTVLPELCSLIAHQF